MHLNMHKMIDYKSCRASFYKSCDQLCSQVWTACCGSNMTIWQTINWIYMQGSIEKHVQSYWLWWLICFEIFILYFFENHFNEKIANYTVFLSYMRINDYLQILFKWYEKMDEGKCTLRMQLKKGVQNVDVENPGADQNSKK